MPYKYNYMIYILYVLLLLFVLGISLLNILIYYICNPIFSIVRFTKLSSFCMLPTGIRNSALRVFIAYDQGRR